MSTKSRRPPPVTPKAVAMVTPKHRTAGRTGGGKSQAAVHAQAVLDNFDLELEHRTRDMRATLDNALSTFMALVDADLLKLPRAMLGMTLGDLEQCWAGSFLDTHMALAKKNFSSLHPERDEAEVVAAAKRKRAQSPSTPARVAKNPRKAGKASASSTAGTSVSGKRRMTATSKRIKVALPAASGSSTLPQDHVFNPHLPKTPARMPRAPRRNESFFSANGSPVVVGPEGDVGDAGANEVETDRERSDASGESESDSDSDELPNVAEMERKALQKQQSRRQQLQRSESSRTTRKPKRAPSLLFRQGIRGDGAHGANGTASGNGGGGSSDCELGGSEIHIPLSDGRIITFDPARLEAGRIDAELAQGGLGDAEKARVKSRVQEEVVKHLTASLAQWTALKD